MTINTDYAQLYEYGILGLKDSKEHRPLPFDQWPALVKKHTQAPHWHSRLKGKAKL